MTGYASLSDAELIQQLQLAQAPNGSPTPQPNPVQVQTAPPLQGAKPSPTYNAGFDPSQLTDAQLSAYAADNDPKMSSPEDFGRSVLGGLDRGVAGMATGVKGLQDVGRNVAQAGVSFLGRHGIGDGQLHMPEHSVGNLPTLPDYLQILARAAGKATGTDPTMAQIGVSAMMPGAGMSSLAPSPEKAAVAINGGIPIHTPQTVAGDYGQRVAEFAPAMGMPGGAATRLARALVPGVASQAAQDAVPDNLKGAAAMAGALLGGGVTEGGVAVANAPYKLVSQAMSELKPEQIAAGLEAQQSAANLPGGGLHITPPEAIGSKAMLGLQHFAENAPAGRKLTDPIFANRPAQVENVVRALADKIGPEDTQPSASALANQGAAEDILRKADTMRSGLTRPHYQAADQDVVSNISDLHQGLREAIAADKTGKIAPVLKEFASDLAPGGQPLTDVGSLDTIRKIWRDRLDLPPNSQNALAKTISAKVGPFVGQLDDMMEGSSKAFQKAKAVHADVSQNVVNPINNGPVGRIANADQLSQQLQALFPSQPVEGAARETGTAANLLPPDVTANLARHHVIDTFNTANTDLQAGPNQWAGARYAKALAGHDERAAALDSTLNAIDQTGELAGHKDELLSALQATGRRMQPGSGTEFNRQQAGVFGASPRPIQIISRLLDPLEYGRHIDAAVGGKLYQSKVELVAKMLGSTPDEAASILDKAQKSRGSILPQLLLGSQETRH